MYPTSLSIIADIYIKSIESSGEMAKEKTITVMEFSKKILFVTLIVAIIIIAYAMWIQYLIITKDYQGGTEIVTSLIVALGAEVTAGTSFYYWKSKKENEIKLRKQYGIEVEDGDI